ncbi:MAG TPA: hypothetical protein VNY84_08050, partial [Acidimicrobiales bacterium]|nr:hypothetical protein [Acidimicrobiales bacterium]
MSTLTAMHAEGQRRWRVVGLIVVVLGLLLGLSSGAGAAGSPPSPQPTGGGFDFGVEPYTAPGAPVRGAFEYDVAAGQTINDRVMLVNNTSAAKALVLYGADAFTAEVGGGFALRPHSDPLHDAGGWIGLPVANYTVPANTIALVPVSFNVPADATPGDHIAGVVAEEVVPNVRAQSGTGFVTVHRVAARLYLRVAGVLRPQLSVQNFLLQHSEPLVPYVTGRGTVKVVFTVANTGNVRVKLDKVTVKLTGLFGGTVKQSSLSRAPTGQPQTSGLPDELLPGGKVLFTREFKSLPPIDRLTAHVVVDGHDPVLNSPIHTSRTETYWIIPWLVLLIAAALVAGIWWWRRRRREA